MITMNDIINEDNIRKSLKFMKKKPDSCGSDGVYLSELDTYWERNKKQICERIRENQYTFGIVKQIDLLQKSGKNRRISIYNSIDRLLLHTVSSLLETELDRLLCDCSYAFRRNKGVIKAAEQAAKYINTGEEYVVKIDITNYFDEINHDILRQQLYDAGMDEDLIDFVIKSISVTVEYDNELTETKKGIIQGNPLSPILSNIYLNKFDREVYELYGKYCRYCDDMIVFTASRDEAESIYNNILTLLSEYKLVANLNKSKITKSSQLLFLGYNFTVGENGAIFFKKNVRFNAYYSNWYREAVQNINSEYHIIDDGIITKKDYSILFQNEDNKFHIPVEVTDTLNIYSNIVISSEFLTLAAQNGIVVNLFGKFSDYLGSYIPRNKSNGSVIIKQAESYIDENKRNEIALSIELAASHNICSNLKYYKKRIGNENFIAEAENEIEILRERLKLAESTNDMLTIEAQIRKIYYSCLNDILPDDDFYYSTRSKRPPKDAINAMISFGNVYMYNLIACEIYKSQLDIRISYIHSPMNRNENLNLDLAELFKPIIVDRVIFTMINKHMISEIFHFGKMGDGIYLNRQGKRIFIEQLENKLAQTIKNNDRIVTYRSLIRNEVKKLQAAIINDTKYKPYKYY